MDNVTSLDDHKEGLKPHASGECKCLACGKEWVGVVSLPTDCDLECPECGLMRGVLKYPMNMEEGAIVRVCNCGCDCYRVTPDFILCVSCGQRTSYSELMELVN